MYLVFKRVSFQNFVFFRVTIAWIDSVEKKRKSLYQY